MNFVEKLKWFGEKIKSSTTFDDSFVRLVGIELYDFIQEDNELKSEFDRRLNYLKNLAEDKSFNLLQDNLFNTIQKILKLTSLQEAQEAQQKWNNGNNGNSAVANRLKYKKILADGREDVWLTLPELYLALQKKESYYRLGDNPHYSSIEGEISKITHIVPIKNQYRVNVETFFKRVFYNKYINNKKGQKRLNELNTEYDDYFYKLDELICRIPIKLHTQNFEQFFLDCMELYPRRGYEWYHDFLTTRTDRRSEKEFKKIQENTLVVIDDLVITFEKKEPPKIKKMAVATPIKDARLDKKSYLLEINNGEKIISFKSKKKGEGLEEKETKQFKILYHLWDFRWELKNGTVLKKGDFASLENLVKGSGSESTEAAYKHIQRLNNRFKNEGVAIEISGENEKYRLTINKA